MKVEKGIAFFSVFFVCLIKPREELTNTKIMRGALGNTLSGSSLVRTRDEPKSHKGAIFD